MKFFSKILSFKGTLLLLVLSVATLLHTQAQSRISGKVMDPMGEPATLVTVELLSKTDKVLRATVTDIEGNYSINMAHMNFETLRFSFLGCETMEINAHVPTPLVQMISSMKNVDSEQANVSKLGFQ